MMTPMQKKKIIKKNAQKKNKKHQKSKKNMSEKSHLNLTWIRVRIYRMFLLSSFLLYGDWRPPAHHAVHLFVFNYEQAGHL